MKIEFNPDSMTVHDLKEVAVIMRTLILRRRMYAEDPSPLDPEMFVASFDTMTQKMEVS
jgi:hypothetical protein